MVSLVSSFCYAVPLRTFRRGGKLAEEREERETDTDRDRGDGERQRELENLPVIYRTLKTDITPG